MNRLYVPRFAPVALVLALTLAPSLSMGEQPPFGRANTPLPPLNQRTIPYVDQIMISVVPEHEPAFGKPLAATLVQRISQLVDVRITYVRNGGGYHLLQLPKKGYEADGEALCEKIKQDSRVTGCSPSYMFQLQSVTAPNEIGRAHV